MKNTYGGLSYPENIYVIPVPKSLLISKPNGYPTFFELPNII